MKNHNSIDPEHLMVVFEGPECTGKSTVIQRLAEEYSCPVCKRVKTARKFNLLTNIIEDINQQRLRTSVGGERLIIFDRWQLVSDIVYEKFQYCKTSILEPIYPTLAQECKAVNILIIYMTIDEKEMIARFKERGDRLIDLEGAKTIRRAYQDFFAEGNLGSILPFEKLDVSKLNQEEVYKAVINIINKHGGSL